MTLADRIEAADGPSRELDAFIAAATEINYPNVFDIEQSCVDDREYLVMVSDPAGDSVDVIKPERFTSSIDSALTLADGLTEAQIWMIWNDALSRCSSAELDIRKDVARFFSAAALRARGE